MLQSAQRASVSFRSRLIAPWQEKNSINDLTALKIVDSKTVFFFFCWLSRIEGAKSLKRWRHGFRSRTARIRMTNPKIRRFCSLKIVGLDFHFISMSGMRTSAGFCIDSPSVNIIFCKCPGTRTSSGSLCLLTSLDLAGTPQLSRIDCIPLPPRKGSTTHRTPIFFEQRVALPCVTTFLTQAPFSSPGHDPF